MDDIEQSHPTNEHISAKQWRSSTRYILMLNDKLHSTVCWFHKTCIARWTTNECTIRLLTVIFPSIVTTYTMLERTNSRVGVENYRKKCTMWCDKVCRIRGIARNSQARNINLQQARMCTQCQRRRNERVDRAIRKRDNNKHRHWNNIMIIIQ